MALRTTLSTLTLALAVAPLTAQKVGTEAPDLTWSAVFEFGDIANSKLSDLRGSVVLLEFFGVRSLSSRQEIKRLNELHAASADMGLVVIGVTSEEAGEVGAYVAKYQVKHPVAVGFNEEYDPSGVPDAFLIDKDGKIVWRGHPAALEMELINKTLVGAKPAIVLAGLEDVQTLRRAKDHGAAYSKAKTLLATGGLSEGAQAQAKDWIETTERRIAVALVAADAALAAKDPYAQWVALEPVAAFYDGVPGADGAKARFEALMADAKNKREIEAGRKYADARASEATFDFDGAYAIYKEIEKAFGGTKAAKAAGLAYKAIEKDGKLGYQHTCGYCKAGGRACPQHSKNKKKK